jgi:toxin-antitoxin system PIN domain toxin
LSGQRTQPFLVDTNLLVYAFRPEQPEHRVARSWLAGLLGGSERIGLTSSTLAGFVRIVTHRRVFRDPAGIDEALGFVSTLRAAPSSSELEPGATYPDIFDGLCRSLSLRGDDIPDAHLAAIAIEHDAVLATHDRGFGRFSGLRTLDPLA